MKFEQIQKTRVKARDYPEVEVEFPRHDSELGAKAIELVEKIDEVLDD